MFTSEHLICRLMGRTSFVFLKDEEPRPCITSAANFYLFKIENKFSALHSFFLFGISFQVHCLVTFLVRLALKILNKHQF